MQSPFVENVCLPYLLSAQNEDGGWGFQAGSLSRAEPTAWALIALQESVATPAQQESASRALRFLEKAQLADGSWPSAPGLREGSWVTSVVCLALAGQSVISDQLTRGVQWLCRELPGEASRLHRAIRSVFGKKNTGQNASYFGWSWTAGTASWVEPTSYAILLFRLLPANMRSEAAERRRRLGETMLYDRMCPGGGWNCGNPMVYGVPGEPQVTSTVWALLALREHPQQPEVQKSLSWLEGFSKSVKSPASLALALIAFHAYERPDVGMAESLGAMYQTNEILWTVPEVAWASLALSGTQNWLQPKSSGAVTAGRT
jgi:hypothetical protein